MSFWKKFEIISGMFPRAEIKLFQTDDEEGWNNFEIILFYMQPRDNGRYRYPFVGELIVQLDWKAERAENNVGNY